MLSLMLSCDQAITSPSTISYEYLSVGGLLYLQITADNQRNINRYFLEAEIAFDFDQFPEKDEDKIRAAMTKQKEILDGQSDQRILEVFLSLKETKTEH